MSERVNKLSPLIFHDSLLQLATLILLEQFSFLKKITSWFNLMLLFKDQKETLSQEEEKSNTFWKTKIIIIIIKCLSSELDYRIRVNYQFIMHFESGLSRCAEWVSEMLELHWELQFSPTPTSFPTWRMEKDRRNLREIRKYLNRENTG